MGTEPASGTQKRAADRDACTQDHSTATKMLQQLLPMLRPHQTGSLSSEARLALLIDAWVKQAGAENQLASSDRAQLASVLRTVQPHSKSRFKKQVGDMWDLIEKAAPEEKAELVSLVIKLASSEGRAKLIALHGARFESANDVDVMSSASSVRCVPHAGISNA